MRRAASPASSSGPRRSTPWSRGWKTTPGPRSISSTSTATACSTATAACPNDSHRRGRPRIPRLEEILRDKKADAPRRPRIARRTPATCCSKQPDGQPDFVSADKLGANLHRHRVALVILSACQSAAWRRRGRADPDEQPTSGRWAASPRG